MAFLLPKRTCDLLITVLLTTALSPTSARADHPEVYLWGFQRACESVPDINRGVEKRLYTDRRDVALLRSTSGQPLPACPGGQEEKCAQSLGAVCSITKGRVLGGQIVNGQDTLRSRLWLYDLATRQIAYQDDYCQGCGEIPALSAQARQLIDHPVFGTQLGPKPAYCSPSTGATPLGAMSAPPPIFLTVFGEGRHKVGLSAVLKQLLGNRGNQILPMPYEPRSYGPEELQKIVAGQPDAQVLGAESRKDGSVFLFLYDAKSKRLTDRLLECEDCTRDKDDLAFRVQPEVAAMFKRCFGFQCADPRVRPPGIETPTEACEAFPAPLCSGTESLLSTTSPATASASRLIDPSTAKIMKGLTWGAFAVSAATAIGLFAANSAGAGSLDNMYGHTADALVRPAWTATGFAVLSLGVAIPATILVDRASASTIAGTSPPLRQSSAIQCPN